ncbi:hypothetical protein OPV22_007568 [Ensete ventricosum]|uniref:RING-type domain-containing protein n=1 Tax=Ensete ventricosum TaxID=4639 RepID=A0AAV8Q7G1_ENSVE|nr:hypothetical protein OPV22_007568 [Ensete ventricosum]
MAVEAHQLHLFPSQLLTRREIINSAEKQPGSYDMQTVCAPPASIAAAVYNSPVVASDSGLTEASRKRTRPVSFRGVDSSSHLQQQMMLDIDGLILQHAEKVRAEVAERRNRLVWQIVAAMEEGASRRLKAMEEEITRLRELNRALEGRIKSLCVENQIWRDLAWSNEATATVLRTNLEQLLASQARAKAAAALAAGDAVSCCCGDNGDDGHEEGKAGARRGWGRACRSCREGEPSVLLLPCRHLCLCAACGPAVAACPICNCRKNATVNVNMS